MATHNNFLAVNSNGGHLWGLTETKWKSWHPSNIFSGYNDPQNVKLIVFQAAKLLTFESMLCWISENHWFARWKKKEFWGDSIKTSISEKLWQIQTWNIACGSVIVFYIHEKENRQCLSIIRHLEIRHFKDSCQNACCHLLENHWFAQLKKERFISAKLTDTNLKLCMWLNDSLCYTREGKP